MITQQETLNTDSFPLSLQTPVTFTYKPDRKAPITIQNPPYQSHITAPTTNHKADLRMSTFV